MSKEQFARFKNQILGGTVLRDGPFLAQILGDMDFEFWRNIHETEPYLQSSADLRLDDLTKGKIILERLEKEPSPKRFAELLKAIYEALVLFSATPKNFGDSWWQTYVHRLQAEREATGFTDLQIAWVKEPQVAFTDGQPVERYYIPGSLDITYTGDDWNVEESQTIIQQGFNSAIVRDIIEKKKSHGGVLPKEAAKPWYERPAGLITITVIGGVITAGIVFYLRWN